MRLRAPRARFAAAALAVAALTSGCDRPPEPIPMDPAAHAAAVEAFAANRIAELRAPDSWLSLIGLHWLDEPVTTMGSAEGSDILLPAGAPRTLGSFVQGEAGVTFAAADGVEVIQGVDSTLTRMEGTGAIPLDTLADPRVTTVFMTPDDLGGGKSVVARYGTLNWIVIRRGDRWAVRLRDNASERYAAFPGIERYPTAEAWRVTARWVPQRKTIAVTNVLGMVSDVESPARVEFRVDGRKMSLDVPGGAEDGRSMLVFADATSGAETYGGGRFLWIGAPDGDNRVVLDFNLAFNPPCVWSEFATCPLPTKENRLPVRVEAGEKRWIH